MSPYQRRFTDRPGGRRQSETPSGPDQPQFPEASDEHPPAGYDGPLRRRDDRLDPPGGAAAGGTGAIGGGTYYGESEESEHHGEAAWDDSEWRRGRQGITGRDAGRGPLSYRRSDERLRDEIREQLIRHPDVPTGEVEVLVEGGEVTLQGTVEDRDIRWLVEDLVEAVSGVSLVHNRLRIERG
jgi:osmotically-inducible protein OsmY